jgi:hypothetical protein
MKNHQSRPTGSSPFPEVNATSFPKVNATSFKENRGRGRGRGPRRGRGRGRKNVWRREGHNFKSNDNNVGRYKKENNSTSSKKFKSSCYKCDMINHWSRTCRTPKHLVELYQASIKKKRKEVETNFIENESSDLLMDTHLDVCDFFENVDKEINIMSYFFLIYFSSVLCCKFMFLMNKISFFKFDLVYIFFCSKEKEYD